MLHRSQRLLVQTISRGFCSTGGKKSWNKKKRPQADRAPKQPQQPQGQQDMKMNWADIHLQEGMKGLHERKMASKEKFYQTLQRGDIDQEMAHHVENINKELSQNILEQNMKLYFQAKFDSALSFTAKAIIGVRPDAEHAKHTINRIFQKCIEGLIVRRDLDRLDSFFGALEKHYEGERKGCLEYNNSEMVDSLTIISEWQVAKSEQALKYSVLNKFVRVAKLKLGSNNELKARVTSFFRKAIGNVIALNNQKRLDGKGAQNFEQLFTYSIQASIWKSAYYKEKQFYDIIEVLYFNKGGNKSLYKNFFAIFSMLSNKFDEATLQEFYKRFSRKLLDAKLSTTDSKGSPLPIDKVFLENYQKSFHNNNPELVLACTAIAFSNNYLSIPAHFLQYQNQAFQSIPKRQVEAIKNEYCLRELSDAYNGRKQTGEEVLESCKQKLSQKPSLLTNLKKAIVTKDFDEAMEIFKQNFFNEPCLKKQREKIKFVLEKLLLEQFGKIKNKRKVSAIRHQIAKFVESLSDEYLTESWKKSEDVGYLLEDYYIIQKPPVQEYQQEDYYEEGEQAENQEAAEENVEENAEENVEENVEENAEDVEAGEGVSGELIEAVEITEETEVSKEQKRHEFWNNYFKLKRAVDISRFEYIDGLKSIRESQKEPALPGQFNLNQYLSEENFDAYRDLEYYGNKKQTELKIYLYRAEVAIDDCEIVGLEKSAQRLLERQNNLCAENLKILEDFGIKDYDISLYDHDELLARIETLRKFGGVLKDVTNKNPFLPQSTFSSLIKEQDEQTGELQEGEEVEQIEGEEGEGEEIQAAEEVDGQEQVNEEAAEEEVGEEQVQLVEEEEAEEIPVGERHISEVEAKDLYLDEKSESFKMLSTNLVDVARVKNRDLFIQAEMTVKLEKDNLVEELIEFGIEYRQPMAVYMGEKLAMVTGQMIPHHIAIRVSDLFSHSREKDAQLEQLSTECKRCLSLMGPIHRQMIYDSNKIYQHISHRPYFQSMTNLYNSEVKGRLVDLVGIKHTQPWENNEPRQNMKRMTKNYIY